MLRRNLFFSLEIIIDEGVNTLMTQSVTQMASETKANTFTFETQEDIKVLVWWVKEVDDAPLLVIRAFGFYEEMLEDLKGGEKKP